jgi:hypothetical protein
MVHIQVVSSSGRIVLSYDLNPGSSKAAFTVSSFANGIYLVTIQGKDFSSCEKLSVIK